MRRIILISFLPPFLIAQSAFAGPGCDFGSSIETTDDAINFVDNLLDDGSAALANPKTDFLIELPVCITDIHANVDQVTIGCHFLDKSGSPHHDVGTEIGEGARKTYFKRGDRIADIDEVLTLEAELRSDVSRSDISSVICEINSFEVDGVGYTNVGGQYCDRDHPDELCGKKGTKPVTRVEFFIDP